MKNLLRNWDAPRVIRMLAGIGLSVYAVVSAQYLFLILGGMFIIQGLLNVSCCGAGGCSTSPKKEPQQEVYKGQIKKI